MSIERLLINTSLAVIASVVFGCEQKFEGPIMAPDIADGSDGSVDSSIDSEQNIDLGQNPDSPPDTRNQSAWVRAKYGLQNRPDNPNCVARSKPVEQGIALEHVFPNLTFLRPTWAIQEPTPPHRWYVLEQSARVRVFPNDQAVAEHELAITIRDRTKCCGEFGLLSMQFHPEWPQSNEIFLSYASTLLPTPEDATAVSMVSRFQTRDGGATFDPDSEDNVIEIFQPFTNHNGGHILWGPDGYLYLGLGDGGSGGDPFRNGQNTNTLLGSILRIDPLTEKPYAIPPDNPFASSGQGQPEIYAWGVRNPWRFSFAPDGTLWVGDVGGGRLEEVNRIEIGGNYGWPSKEGWICFRVADCAVGPWIDPVFTYQRSADADRAITGGHVYRGSVDSLQGSYVFADYASGRIWKLVETENGAERVLLIQAPFRISSFFEDISGELHVLNFTDGTMHKIISNDVADALETPFPRTLSETGCVEVTNPKIAGDGTIPYSVKTEFWTDGLNKTRAFALPNDTIAAWTENTLSFPNGAVTIKTIYDDDRPLETRLMMKDEDQWSGYTYLWRDDLSDADLVKSGATIAISNGDWKVPTVADCSRCHFNNRPVLGLQAHQLDRVHRYQKTERVAPQLDTLEKIGVIEPRPEDIKIVSAQREYLHTNCSHCHNPAVNDRVDLDLRRDTPLERTQMCRTAKIFIDGHLPTVGEAILDRLSRRDAFAMPPFGSQHADLEAFKMLRPWLDEKCKSPRPFEP